MQELFNHPMEISVPDSPHFRNIIGIIMAMLLGVIVVGTIESIGHTVYPPPADLDMNDAKQMKKYMQAVPVPAMLFVLVAWATGIFSGCLLAGVMGVKQGAFCCLVYSFLFSSVVILMLYQIPSPLWFTITGVAILAPCALAGWYLSRIILFRWGTIQKENAQAAQ